MVYQAIFCRTGDSFTWLAALANAIGPSYIPGELGYALLASGDWGLLSYGSPHFAKAIGPSYITGEL